MSHNIVKIINDAIVAAMLAPENSAAKETGPSVVIATLSVAADMASVLDVDFVQAMVCMMPALVRDKNRVIGMVHAAYAIVSPPSNTDQPS